LKEMPDCSSVNAELMTAEAIRLLNHLKSALPLLKNKTTREGYELAIASLKRVLAAKIRTEEQP